MSDYVYQTAIKDEIKEIKAINEACLPENYPVETYEKLINTTLVCKHDGKIAGYAILASLQTDDKDLLPFSYSLKQKQCHTVLFSLAVLPEYRNKGIATKLLKLVLESNKKNPTLLHARKSNAIANHIYTKAGFSLVKETPGYYQNPDEDGFILAHFSNKLKHLKKLTKAIPKPTLTPEPTPSLTLEHTPEPTITSEHTST